MYMIHHSNSLLAFLFLVVHQVQSLIITCAFIMNSHKSDLHMYFISSPETKLMNLTLCPFGPGIPGIPGAPRVPWNI